MMRSRLLEILQSKDSENILFPSLQRIKKAAEPLLAMISQTFPEYTNHNINHKEKVLEKLDLVIPASFANELNTSEIYFLLAAVYLHDIGMANLPELLDSTKPSTEKEIQEHIRRHHHVRVADFIHKNYSKLGIENPQAARIIATICKGHRKENLHDKSIFDFEEVYLNNIINVPLLTSFLRIADELDMTFERTPLLVYQKTPPSDPISKQEWEKHLSVSGVTINLEEDPLTIIAKAHCTNPKIHRLLKSLESKINLELIDLPYHLHHYRKFRKDIPRKITINIHAEGYAPRDIKFSIQEKQIFQMLMGEKLYKNKIEAIREILKNSIDSCNLRKDLSQKEGTQYSPYIEVKISDDGKFLTVTDNGLGMDEDIVERYFTKVGISYYRSSEFMGLHTSFTPVSELGIGTLAYFMIAQKIEVETKMSDSNPLHLEIEEVSDYFFVNDGQRKDTGTTVTLHILPEFIGNLDLLNTIRYFIRHVDIPIKFTQNNKSVLVEKNNFTLDKNIFPVIDDTEIEFYEIMINNTYVEGKLYFAGIKENSSWRPFTKRPEYDIRSRGKKERYFLSYEGIFVGNHNILPSWFYDGDVYCDLNVKQNAVDLDAPRENVIKNEKLHNLTGILEKILLQEFDNLFTTNHNFNENNPNSAKIRGRFFDLFTRGSDYHYDNSGNRIENELSPEFIDFVEKYYTVWELTSNGLVSVTPGDIKRRNKEVLAIWGLPTDPAYVQLLFVNCKEFKKDKIFVVGYSDDFLASVIGYYDKKHFTQLLQLERSDELIGIIPKTWILARILEYKTGNFFEHISYPTTILNRDHRFVDLLITSKSRLNEQQKLMLLGLFNNAKRKIKTNFDQFINQQYRVLEMLADLKIIKNEEINQFLVKKEEIKGD